MKKKKNYSWFANVVESKGAKELEEIEHLLKMKDEEYRMQEDLELREAEKSKSLFAGKKLENLKKRIEQERFERDNEIRERLAHYRTAKEEEKHNKIVTICCILLLVLIALFFGLPRKSETKSNSKTATTETTKATPVSTKKSTTASTLPRRPRPSPTPTPTATPDTVHVAELSYDELTDDEKALYRRTAGQFTKWSVSTPEGMKWSLQYEIENIKYDNIWQEYTLPKDSYTEEEKAHVMQAVDWYKVCVWFLDLRYDSGQEGCEHIAGGVLPSCYLELYPTKESLYNKLLEDGFTADQANYGIETSTKTPKE